MDGFTNQINNISLKKTKIVALYLHFYLNVFETFSFEMLNIYKTLKLEKYIERLGYLRNPRSLKEGTET